MRRPQLPAMHAPPQAERTIAKLWCLCLCMAIVGLLGLTLVGERTELREVQPVEETDESGPWPGWALLGKIVEVAL